MRSRRIISVIALLGVLLHAGAVARHHAAMLGSLLQYEALLSDFAHLCRSGQADPAHAGVPSIPRPADNTASCPICSGLASAFLLAGPEPLLPTQTRLTAPAYLVAPRVLPPPRHAVAPPARGPPALA